MTALVPEIYTIDVLAAGAIRDFINIVIVTATDVERDAVRADMRPLHGTSGLGRVRTASHSYYLGFLGKYPVAHVECTMGAVGTGAAQNTTNDAIAFWAPRLVLMPGIAFGMDSTAQALEDILIAESVIAYEPARVGPGKLIRRGREIPAGTTILERFRDQRGFRVGRTPKIGLMLSGEKLVDDPEFKSALSRDFPTAIGGEMEGAGVASACQHHGVQWGLVKAICDWGDGTKNKDHQEAAAKKAMGFVTLTFWQDDLLPNLPVELTPSAYRLISGKRARFLHRPSEIGAIADLFSDARASALFGEDAAGVLAHAARELIRNAFMHGGASTASVELGEQGIILRDNGSEFDPRKLARRLRAPGRDAGSFVVAELAGKSGEFAIDYTREAGAEQNVLSIRMLIRPNVESMPACTMPPIPSRVPETDIDDLMTAASACPEVYYDARHNLDLSSSWRAVTMLLERLGKEQFLVVCNASDRLLVALLAELNHPQLLFRNMDA